MTTDVIIISLIVFILLLAYAFMWFDERHARRLKEAEKYWHRNIFEECQFNDCQLKFEKGNAVFIDQKDVDWDAELKKLPKDDENEG